MFNLFRRWGHHLLPSFHMVTSRSTDSRGTCSARSSSKAAKNKQRWQFTYRYGLYWSPLTMLDPMRISVQQHNLDYYDSFHL